MFLFCACSCSYYVIVVCLIGRFCYYIVVMLFLLCPCFVAVHMCFFVICGVFECVVLFGVCVGFGLFDCLLFLVSVLRLFVLFCCSRVWCNVCLDVCGCWFCFMCVVDCSCCCCCFICVRVLFCLFVLL